MHACYSLLGCALWHTGAYVSIWPRMHCGKPHWLVTHVWVPVLLSVEIQLLHHTRVRTNQMQIESNIHIYWKCFVYVCCYIFMTEREYLEKFAFRNELYIYYNYMYIYIYILEMLTITHCDVDFWPFFNCELFADLGLGVWMLFQQFVDVYRMYLLYTVIYGKTFFFICLPDCDRKIIYFSGILVTIYFRGHINITI